MGVIKGDAKVIAKRVDEFILGSMAFVQLAKTERKSVQAYIAEIKKFAGKFAPTLIKAAKGKLIKILGRTAALRILGGFAGVATFEALAFTYNLSYYAIKYYRK